MGWSETMTSGFTVFTLLVLVFAVMDHHWILVETNRQSYYSGLWKVCIKMVCPTLIAMAPNVQGAKTLLVLALFCGLVGASFMTFTYRYSSSFTMYRYLVAAFGSFIAAALVFLALSIYTIRISTHGISRTATVTYQWSFYVAWTSCPFFILSGLFGLAANQRLVIHGSSLSDGESTISSSSSSWTTASSSYFDEEEFGGKLTLEQQNEKTGGPTFA